MSAANLPLKTPTAVKFCGLRTEADISAVNQIFAETKGLAPKYAGFICVPQRHRFVPPAQLAVLRKKLAAGVQAVGVFQNAPITQIHELAARGIIDLVQLHGTENQQYVHELRITLSRLQQNCCAKNIFASANRAAVQIIQAFGIQGVEDIQEANRSAADYVLCDTAGGGSGTSFNWQLLAQMTRPYILAGGLNPKNVGEAVARFAPCGVDVSSGIENEDGAKDLAQMRKFAFAVFRNSV